MNNPTLKEIAGKCAADGFGHLPGDTCEEIDGDGQPVIVGGYLMPRWMAEVLGRVGNKENEKK